MVADNYVVGNGHGTFWLGELTAVYRRNRSANYWPNRQLLWRRRIEVEKKKGRRPMRLSIAAFIMMAELLVLQDEGRGATRAEENVLQASKSLKRKQEDL